MDLDFDKIENRTLTSEREQEYTIKDKIDKGGGGNVCLCIDSEEEQFAVKIFSRIDKEDNQRTKAAIKRFKNERKSHRNLDHPNVVSAIDWGLFDYEDSQLPYYIMPKARENLDDFFKTDNIKDKPLEVKRIFNEILDGLIYLHDSSIIHRDIKPKNILVYHDGSIKIADFGMAHLPDKYKEEPIQTPTDAFHSNQYYVNENRSSDDPRIDICALGRVFHELLVGSFPSGTGVLISTENSYFDNTFDEIVTKMTKTDIDERYQSLKEVKADLEKYYHKTKIKLRNSLDDNVYEILLRLNNSVADQFEAAILTLKNQSHSGRLSQAANSLKFVCTFLLTNLDKWNSNAKMLPIGSRELRESLLKELEEYCGYITKVADFNKSTDEIEFNDKLTKLEELIQNLLKSNLDIVSKLDNLLKIKKPSSSDINKLIHLISSPSHSQYFFTRLKSPYWLDRLIKKEFFSNPPIRSKRFPVMVHIWPQVNYLVNISSIRPEKVLALIDDFYNDRIDVTIYRSILMCIYNMPVSTSKKSIPLIRKLNSRYSSISELVYIKKIINNFFHEKEIDSAYKLLEIVFTIDNFEKTAQGIQFEKFSFLFSDFQDIINKFIELDKSTNNPRFLKQLSTTFTKLLKLEFSSDPENCNDYSEIWRKTIESNKEFYKIQDSKNLFVDQIRDYFLNIGSNDVNLLKKAFEILDQYKWPIFSRIKLFVLSKFSDFFSEQIVSYLTKKEIFFNNNLWTEYYTLIKDNFNTLTDEQKEKVFNWIREGPDLSRYQVTSKDFTNKTEYKKWKRKSYSRWVRRKSEPIFGYLSSDLKKLYKKLVEDDGKIKKPQFYRNLEKPRLFSASPMRTSEIKNLNIEELISYLNQWEPKKHDIFSSKSSLGASINRIIASEPKKYEALLDRLEKIPMFYISYIINGFSSTIEDKKELDVHNVLYKIILMFDKYELTFWLQEYPDIFNEIVSLFRIVLNMEKQELQKNLLNHMWKIISGMLEIKLDISNNASNYHDFFTFAINNIEGKILLTCLSYALYQSKIKGFAERSELTPEVKKEFDQLLDKKDFYEITVSILSSNLNLLLYLDEEWIKTKIKILFPENDQHLWKIAWESYISYQNLNPITYKLLKKHYLKAVLEYKEFTFSDKAIEGLGSHIILLYIHDLEDLENNSIIYKFFTNVDLEARSRAMWFNLHIWEKYKNTSQEQEVLVKILELWEFRINQIKSEESLKIEDYNRELGWYLMLFEKLPTQGRQIEILADILELTEGKAGTTSIFILDKLSKYVEIDPHNVLRIIKVLLIGSEQYFYLTEEAKILEIIEKIVKLKGLEEFKREVIHIAEMLLSEGFYGIRKTNFYNKLNLSE